MVFHSNRFFSYPHTQRHFHEDQDEGDNPVSQVHKTFQVSWAHIATSVCTLDNSPSDNTEDNMAQESHNTKGNEN